MSSIQEKFNEFLLGVLDERLFESGRELAKLLTEKFNINNANARKILTRVVKAKIIRSSKPFTFGKGQFIYLLPGQDLDSNKIKLICEIYRPPIYRLLEFMDQNEGIISVYEALKITASPEDESSTKVNTLKDIIKVLRKLDIVYEKGDNNGVNYILYKIDKSSLEGEFNLLEDYEKELMAKHYTKMVIDCSLIPDITRWMNKVNIIDNLMIIYRNKNAPSVGGKHNNVLWDVFSYTKTTGINPYKGVKADTPEKQTLVVMDIILSGSYNQIHLDGFYQRVQINLNSVKEGVRKALPIIVYREITDEVLNKISKLGFLAFDIGAIFGTKIYYVLQKIKELQGLLSEAKDIDKTVDSVLETLRNSGQEEALKDLKGTLFETLMYPLLSHIYPNAYIERNKKINTDSGEAKYYEYDYIINSSTPPEILVVELKGYNSSATIALGDSNTKSTLNWFFRKTLPSAERFLKKKFEDKPIRGVFITSANFWDDGRKFLTKMNLSRYKPRKLNTGYARGELLELLNYYGFKNEINIIEKYYTKVEE